MSALLISEQMFTVGTKQLARTGNYAALLPDGTEIGWGAAEVCVFVRTIFISVQS